MELRGNNPKGSIYTDILRKHFSKSWKRKLKKKFSGEKQKYSRGEISEILTGEQDKDSALQFADKLIEEGVFQEAGKRENASGGVPVFTYAGNKKLLEAYSTTPFYQNNRDLFVDTLEKAEGKELI
jgi:hypothetical protein